jgi:predicted RNA binding protein YcfA (HicA-like mRNA interferase family)
MPVPMKVSEIVRLFEQDGSMLKRTTGSHRHFTHPTKTGLVTLAGKPSTTLEAQDRGPALIGPICWRNRCQRGSSTTWARIGKR